MFHSFAVAGLLDLLLGLLKISHLLREKAKREKTLADQLERVILVDFCLHSSCLTRVSGCASQQLDHLLHHEPFVGGFGLQQFDSAVSSSCSVVFECKEGTCLQIFAVLL